MKVLKLAFLQFKRMIKDIKVIGFMMIAPILVITIIYFLPSSGSGGTRIVDVAFDVVDKGQYASDILNNLDMSISIYFNDSNKAMENLEKNNVVAVYVIPEDFTEKIKSGKKPEIISYKRQKGNGTALIEAKLNEEINKKIKSCILENNNIIKNEKELNVNTIKSVIEYSKQEVDNNLFFTVVLIFNFIIFSANLVSSELIALRNQKILMRVITTPNKGKNIIASVYLAMVFLQTFIYSVVFILEKFIIGYSLKNASIVLIDIFLVSLVSTSLGVLVTKVFQNEGVVALVINLIGVLTTFLGLPYSGLSSNKTPWIIQNLSKFTPQYWVFNSLETSKIFPNAIVLIFMALALFTAGSSKIRNFVNK